MKSFFSIIFLCCCLSLWSQSFEDVGEEQGLIYVSNEPASFGNGLSFYDIDKNGWDDITFGRVLDSVRVFLNFDGEFQPVSLDLPMQNNAKSVNWVDYDNDGDADLMVTNHYGGCKFYQNEGDLEFTDISESCGLFQDENWIHDSYACCWGDYDNDGFLDVYIGNHCSIESEQEPVYNYLYRNNGDGTFEDVTDEAGVANGLRETFQGLWVDYDRDGLLDLYVINDKVFSPNTMYKNNGDGTFDDVSASIGLELGMDAMSNTFMDFDNDGDLDAYFTNTVEGNKLMRNDDGYYNEVTSQYGVAVNAGCFSSNFFDFDNDMDEDFYISTSTTPGYMNFPPNIAYKNLGGVVFQEVSEIFPENNSVQYNSAEGDFNNDGKQDLVAFNDQGEYSSLWQNTSESTFRFIKVSLEGKVSNRDGISSWIEVYAGGVQQTKFTFCGEDYLTQDSQREHFGLGSNTLVDSLVVSWPSGHVDRFYNLSANQTFHVVEGSSMFNSIESGIFCEGGSTILEVGEDYTSYLWSTGEMTSSIEIDEPGLYSVEFFNEIGVSNTVSLEITPSALPNPEAVVSSTTCSYSTDGTALIENTTGVEIESVFWEEGWEGESIGDLPSGVYYYDLTDANGCTISDSIEVLSPAPVEMTLFFSDTLCFGSCGGAVSVFPSGGTGSFEVVSDTEDLCPGVYSIEVVDELGCIGTEEIEIVELDELMVTLEITPVENEDLGSASVSIEGGLPPYSIQWSTSESGDEILELEEDEYTVTIEDAFGCLWFETFSVPLDIVSWDEKQIAIYPNPTEDFIQLVYGDDQRPDEIRIYGQDGKLVVQEINPQLSVDVRHLSPSIYILEWHAGNQVFHFQWIKK